MGYTHYWKLKRVPNKEQTRKAFMEIEALIETMPTKSETAGGHYNDCDVVLRGGTGEGKPEININEICFNGDAKKHLDHETFYFDFNNDKEIGFAFCKTARKPYDQAVCLSLLSLANHIEGFEFSSDGDKDDWEPAIEFYLNRNGNYISDNLKYSLDKL